MKESKRLHAELAKAEERFLDMKKKVESLVSAQKDQHDSNVRDLEENLAQTIKELEEEKRGMELAESQKKEASSKARKKEKALKKEMGRNSRETR